MRTPSAGDYAILERASLQELFDALRARGYEVVGPTVHGGAIVYETLTSADELPVGWGDEQEAGHYRLRRRDDAACFGYTVGPQSWKQFLHPPEVRLWRATRTGASLALDLAREEPPRRALIGVRACELRAIAVQDRVFLGGAYVDPEYAARRERLFVVAVNCTQAGATCFCASMETGPRAQPPFDLALTELLTPESHRFLIEVGSPAGAELLAALPHTPATADDLAAAEAAIAGCAAHMGRALDTDGLRERLIAAPDDPHWDAVAARCLTCGNCTMVCPTCFCTSVTDTTDLSGTRIERTARWDSCFTLEFTYAAGAPARVSAKSRYRQWLTHKLAYWFDQFGTSGCVGCGRCITWCPAGIDITEEARAIGANGGR